VAATPSALAMCCKMKSFLKSMSNEGQSEAWLIAIFMTELVLHFHEWLWTKVSIFPGCLQNKRSYDMRHSWFMRIQPCSPPAKKQQLTTNAQKNLLKHIKRKTTPQISVMLKMKYSQIQLSGGESIGARLVVTWLSIYSMLD